MAVPWPQQERGAPARVPGAESGPTHCTGATASGRVFGRDIGMTVEAGDYVLASYREIAVRFAIEQR